MGWIDCCTDLLFIPFLLYRKWRQYSKQKTVIRSHDCVIKRDVYLHWTACGQLNRVQPCIHYATKVARIIFLNSLLHILSCAEYLFH